MTHFVVIKIAVYIRRDGFPEPPSSMAISTDFKLICRVCQIRFCSGLDSFFNFGIGADELDFGEAVE